MGDRTSSSVILAGTIAPAQVNTLVAALRAADCDEMDDEIVDRLKAHESAEDIGPIVFTFNEVNYGAMPEGLDEALRALGLRWAWAWDSGDEYGPGLSFPRWAFPSLSDRHFGYDYAEHVVMVPVQHLGNKEHVDACRLAQHFISDASFRVCDPPPASPSGAKTMVCARCGSEDVLRDAWSEWSTENQAWELGTVFDRAHCNACDGECTIEARAISTGYDPEPDDGPTDVGPNIAKAISLEVDAGLIARSVGARGALP